ncbi:MAG: hypothetical protein JJ911_01345 [Rhizobiaceae bacterium]|nr:hypothetical protein [Rhizobiaceae bacterium]
MSEDATAIPCPFTYANGKRCPGHVVRIEGYKADLEWRLEGGKWKFGHSGPRSHYHLFCSAKGNHAGYDREDDPRMKFFASQLPNAVARIIGSSK